jgi:glutaredoxin
MTTPSVLYAIASWSGPRLVNFDDTYLEKHIEQLKKIKHNLTQISIGNPENTSRRDEFEEYVRSLKEVSGVPVVVHDIPNIGRSYGQWSRIYEKYRTQFDYYIFVEDDYQPVLDNFDSVLIEMYNKKKCGFLCGLVLNTTGRYGINTFQEHAGVTNGIASSAVLEKVRERFGGLPHDMGPYIHGQILFSKGFLDCGFSLAEYIESGEYRCMYYQHNDAIRIYGPNMDGKDIFNPKQVVCKEKQFRYIHFKESDVEKPPQIKKPSRSHVIGRRR